MRNYQCYTRETLVELAILGRLYHFYEQSQETQQAVLKRVIPVYTEKAKKLSVSFEETKGDLGNAHVKFGDAYLSHSSEAAADLTLKTLAADYDHVIAALYLKDAPKAYSPSRAMHCAIITSFATTMVCAAFLFAGILASNVPLVNIPLNVTAMALGFAASVSSVATYHYKQCAPDKLLLAHQRNFVSNLRSIYAKTDPSNPKDKQTFDAFKSEAPHNFAGNR